MLINSLNAKFLNAAIQNLHHAAVPDKILLRDAELKKTRIFMLKCIKEQSSGVIVMAGQPGTGKTMCMNRTVQNILNHHPKHECQITSNDVLNINAVSLKDGFSLFERVAEFLHVRNFKNLRKIATNSGIQSVCSCILKNQSKTKIICIDELDRLSATRDSVETKVTTRKRTSAFHKNQEYLQSFFCQLVNHLESKLIVIATTNNLGFSTYNTEQTLLLHFSPYSSREMSMILEQRIGASLNSLEFCCKKISVAKGDCRMVMDACRRIMACKLSELQSEKNQSWDELEEISTNASSSSEISITDVNEVINDEIKRKYDMIKTLPQYQQLLLFSMALLEPETGTLEKVQLKFSQICRHLNLGDDFELSYDNVEDGLNALISCGLIYVVSAKSFRRVGRKLQQIREYKLKMESCSIVDCLRRYNKAYNGLCSAFDYKD